MMSEKRTYVEPTHCPLCGEECDSPDRFDPERLECPEHGLLDVEAFRVEADD